MSTTQPGILADVPSVTRYLTFGLKHGGRPDEILRALLEHVDGERIVVGLGRPLLVALGAEVAGLRHFPDYAGAPVEVPSTPAALWCWLRGEDRGELVQRSRALMAALAGSLVVEAVVDGFRYDTGRDLSGYEDGTENPQGEAAVAAAIVADGRAGLAGSSFVAVQRWVHDLDYFDSLPQGERDDIVGRRISDNEELDDAPVSAHVKRTAQESFSPEAFVLRRSMPWADAHDAGLMFVAFGRDLDAFEALLGRMVGREDGVVDALFRFTRPVTGGYFWCPPMRGGRLDLSALQPGG